MQDWELFRHLGFAQARPLIHTLVSNGTDYVEDDEELLEAVRRQAARLTISRRASSMKSDDQSLTAGGLAAPSLVDFDVEWPAFLARHDMVWRWNASEASWPSSFETAGWTGNGVYGLAPLVAQRRANKSINHGGKHPHSNRPSETGSSIKEQGAARRAVEGSKPPGASSCFQSTEI